MPLAATPRPHTHRWAPKPALNAGTYKALKAKSAVVGVATKDAQHAQLVFEVNGDLPKQCVDQRRKRLKKPKVRKAQTKPSSRMPISPLPALLLHANARISAG